MLEQENFREMINAELEVAVKQIIQTSSSEDEVKKRLASELQYPYSIAITSHIPTDGVGQSARAIAQGLGGLTMKNGAMVMVMMFGRGGEVLHL